MPNHQWNPFILGLDLGSSSLGWAVVDLDAGQPNRLLQTGARIFDPGVSGTDLAIQQGKDESRAVERRQARLQRRQMRRRSARQRDLFELLQQHALLPHYDDPICPAPPHVANARRSEARHLILQKLDADLSTKWKPITNAARVPAADHVLPYFLRAASLSQPLQPFELGRVFYHLGQRRGFKSNRRETARTKEEEHEKSKVYAGIGELTRQMQASGAETLAQFFAGIDPTKAREDRIRGRWTARAMFEGEFDKIWTAQAPHHPSLLTAELRNKLRHLLFFQKPISAQTHLVGKCELEPRHKRAPAACLAAQRFRLLQKVNDLRLSVLDAPERGLTAKERARLLDALETQGDLTFGNIRKLLALPKRGSWFNLERGGEKKLPGNRTKSKMLQAFGEAWDNFPLEKREQIVEDWRNAETEDWLKRRAITRWALDEEHASFLASAVPEPGYSRLSRKAIAKLLQPMEDGLAFKEAEKEVYGTHFSGGRVFEALPPVRSALPALRNPAVERALTELRKVVNAIVRQYGKPREIHIELARDLKRSREDRKEIWKSNRERQSAREKIAARIAQETGLNHPSRADIERGLLWEECGGICPYTGQSIKLADLFGDYPQFDIEHILPFSRCPDDSFANKTLCQAAENRNVKGGRTPWEAYGANSELWQQILERVKRFRNPAKLRRFQVKTGDELDEFTSRQLNDTRYASKLAAQYLGSLYGGRDILNAGATPRRAIYASPGGLTAILRRNWGLEEILREPEPGASERKPPKARTDHRHHAIDAIVIALSTPASVKALSDAASRNASRGRVSFKGLEAPWANFVESIRPRIEEMAVSHRPEHKLSGQLHDETNYGKPYDQNGKSCVHVRKSLSRLSKAEIEDIVDPAVRQAVESRLEELGGDLKKLQAAGADPPFLKAKDGRKIPIYSARIRKTMTPVAVAHELRLRYVDPNRNHHAEILAELDSHDREIAWVSRAVSLLEAYDRRRKGLPIIQRDHGNDHRFKFSLMQGDTVQVQRNGGTETYVVRSVWSNRQFTLVRANDARKLNDIRAASQVWYPNVETLRKHNATKVVVDVLGRIHPAHD